MTVSAILRHARLSPQKARLVADQIRGIDVDKARDKLEFHTKKASKIFRKLLESAIANAEHNAGMDIDILKISKVWVDKAPSLKRFKARAKGRGAKIEKQNCHIALEVTEQSLSEAKKWDKK